MMRDNRLKEAVPLVILFILIAAAFAYDSKNVWFFVAAVVGSSAILGLKWFLDRGGFELG